MTLNVTVKITGEDQPVTLHETLASKKQYIGREDNINEIVKLRMERIMRNISTRLISGEFLQDDQVFITSVEYNLTD